MACARGLIGRYAAHFVSCQAAVPSLMAAERSSIVNISSIQAARGFSGYPGYAATKAGIIGFTQQLVCAASLPGS